MTRIELCRRTLVRSCDVPFRLKNHAGGLSLPIPAGPGCQTRRKAVRVELSDTVTAVAANTKTFYRNALVERMNATIFIRNEGEG